MFLAAILTAAACNSTDSFNPDTNSLPTSSDDGSTGEVQAPAANDVSLATTFAGGIPMGLFHLPNSNYGSLYNGGLKTPSPSYLKSDLAAIKSRGGKVTLNLAGSQKYYKDADGHFSLSKWKARVDRFRNIDISSYIKDGTIIGHYLIDEPYDAANFNGQKVGGATLEAMAKYSKQIWPEMATIVRGEPYKITWSGTYYYLDAAWAQYLYQKGDVNDYLAKNVSSAKNMGLALIIGLNVPDGGPNKATMTSTQVKNWGSTLLNSSYPCAFISWKYGDDALNTSGMKSAMDALRSKAENHTSKTCKG